MNAQTGGAAAAAETGSPGELLRKQRERRALSVQQAAEHLHLDASMIEAIEADRFQALGPPVYARGHLRKYATLLGLSPALVLQRYESLSDTPAVPTPVPASATAPVIRERRSMKVPLLIALAVALVALAWWVFERLTASATEAPGAPPGQVSPSSIDSDLTSALPVEIAPTQSEPEAAAPVTSSPVATIASAGGSEARASANVGEVQLTLEFSAASWTEIYDAAGNRLMFETGAPGLTRTVKGVPPLRVTLGFASAVDARVNGEAIVLPRRAGKDATKFVIEPGGTVR